MRLFTVGPVEMYQHTLDIRKRQIPYFRTKAFSELVLETDAMLKKLVGTSQNSKTIYLTASGTAAMEATVMNCLSPMYDNVLVIEGGTFGKRFGQICDTHMIRHSSILLKEGEIFNQSHLEQFNDEKFTALLVNLHETSSGQLYDIEMLSEYCKARKMYLIVDAISTFLCDKYEMDRFGIDATIISSQKGMCLAPGMSMVILAERLEKERVQKKLAKSMYFDFNNYLVNMERGQTPFTPAIGIFHEMNDMLHFILKTGLDNFLKQIENICFDFRKRIDSLPVDIPKYPLSNALTPIIFRKPVAKYIWKKLIENHGIYVNPCSGSFAENMIRVAHIGNISFKDNEELVNLISLYIG